MPLLPNLGSDFVRTGLWRNLMAPAYQQWLWTATNLEALVFMGTLGILGTIAGDKLWPIIRGYLQPAVQLSDPENKRLKISRNEAIKAFWTEVKHAKKDLKAIWTEQHGFRQKVKMSLGTISGNQRKSLAPMDTTIEMRFGIFAILNIVSFAILGIFIPFFLSEGFQGDTVIQAIEDFENPYFVNLYYAITEVGVVEAVHTDFVTCITSHSAWNRIQYCQDLRNTLPPYKAENINLTDPILANPPYRFLAEKGDASNKALRLSRNTSFRDLGFNSKPGGKKLLHELTCVPVDLGPFIAQANGHFELRVKDVISGFKSHDHLHVITLQDSMILKTSNAYGSGREIYESKRGPGHIASHTEPVSNHGNSGATWYQTDVDATLPRIELKSTEDGAQARAQIAAYMIRGNSRARLQNFLITFKPGEQMGSFKGLSDDPIFGAHSPWRTGEYIADREVSALGCAEVFKVCSADQCSEPPLDKVDGWLDLCYPKTMSVWLSSLFDRTYGDPRESDGLRSFFNVWPNHKRKWQDDIEERFIHSMIRVRHASIYAAEHGSINQDLYKGTNSWALDPLLYRSSDYTNVNFWGCVATVLGYLYIIAASYWPVLLTRLVLPLKFLVWATCMGAERLKALIILAGVWIHVVGNAFRNFVKTRNPLRSRPVTSNTLPMDTWHTWQENDEPDNPPRMAYHHE